MPTEGHRSRAGESRHEAAVIAFTERVAKSLGDRVRSVYLFGSVAAETQRASSDVDLLVVIADEAAYESVDDVLLDIAYDVRLAHGVPVEVHAIREREFDARRDRGEPFVETVLESGTRLRV